MAENEGAGSPFNPLNIRKRFHFLRDQAAAIEAKSAPMRDARDTFVREKLNPLEEQKREMDKEIKETEDGLFEIKQEMALCVRALNGKTGTTANPEDEPEVVAEEDTATEGPAE